nr:hypothetical protein [Sphingomonas sp.]
MDRSSWTTSEILALFDEPLLDLPFGARSNANSSADARLFESLGPEPAAPRPRCRALAG